MCDETGLPPARSALSICCPVVAAGLPVGGDGAHMALGLWGPLSVPSLSGAQRAGPGTRRRGRKQRPEPVSQKEELLSFPLSQELLEPG